MTDWKQKDLEKNAKRLAEEVDYTITNGVMTWNSNDSVPFDDMLDAAESIGIELDRAACTAARDADTASFLIEYVKGRANMSDEQKREEAYERRAAFGPGETIVDVFTGERSTT